MPSNFKLKHYIAIIMEENLENKDKKIDSNDEFDKEEKKELSIEDKLKESQDKVLRSLAEIENQRRRFEKDIKEAFEYGGFNFAKETLSVLDNLQRARVSIQNDKDLKESPNLEKFLKNIDILEKDLISIFEKNKINKIKTLKEKFDPNLHQAMLEIEDQNVEPGTIIQEIQPGYTMGERLLRPSYVGIAKKYEDKSVKKEEEKGD